MVVLACFRLESTVWRLASATHYRSEYVMNTISGRRYHARLPCGGLDGIIGSLARVFLILAYGSKA
jgi:hypothetical protein